MGKLYGKKHYTEKDIQKALIREFNGLKRHKLCIQNVYIYDWESDLLSIDKSDKIYEFEIKCSKWDYLADFKKTDKHEAFRLLNDITNVPNYFYYACSPDIINELSENLPEYAGLITMHGLGIRIIKKAPILHTEKFERWEEVAVKLFYKNL